MKTVKIGMIGAGNIANTHLDSYKSVPAAEIVAICDIDEARLAETADKYGIANRYTSVEKMLAAHPELDAADVCVWNCSHARCTIAALDAGLNVLCEKPMAYNTKEAEEMIEAAKRNGKLLMVGFVCRFSDDARIAKDMIDKGYLGDIYYARAHYVRRHGNPGGWFADIERSGGGPVIDLGVHVIDLIRYLMGSPKPVSVYAATYSNIGKRDYLKTGVGWTPKNAKPTDPCTVEDFGTALIRYDNGAVTQLECSYDFNGPVEALRAVYGTKGGMDLTSGVKLWSTVNDYLADINVDTENLKDSKDLFVAEMEHFVDCVANGTKCRAAAEDGLEVMKILDAIYLSAKTGHEVVL